MVGVLTLLSVSTRMSITADLTHTQHKASKNGHTDKRHPRARARSRHTERENCVSAILTQAGHLVERADALVDQVQFAGLRFARLVQHLFRLRHLAADWQTRNGRLAAHRCGGVFDVCVCVCLGVVRGIESEHELILVYVFLPRYELQYVCIRNKWRAIVLITESICRYAANTLN